MKLAVSNIAWPLTAEPELLRFFAAAGITGIEVAPTKLWPEWNGASEAAARAYSDSLARNGFALPALQSILFAKPELKLFGTDSERQQLANHLASVARLAAAFRAPYLVFGAPKNRQLGALSPREAFAIAREFFAAVAPVYERSGVCLCLEANPSDYGCTFVTTSQAAAELVRAVAAPGFGLHLDTACLFLAGEDMQSAIQNNLDILRHFHVSEPFLGGFAAPQIDHPRVAAMLRGAGYRGWISLEMRETDQPLRDVPQAAEFLAQTYTREN